MDNLKKRNPFLSANEVPIGDAELILNKDESIYHLNLKEENIADTIITVGDPGRVYRITKHFDSIDFEMNKREFITQTGYIGRKRLTVMSTGMGTDNIEILMNELDAIVNIDLKTRTPKKETKSLQIIRIGTSGAIQEHIPLNSHLASMTGIGFDTLMQFYHFSQTEEENFLVESIKNKLNLQLTPYMATASSSLYQLLAKDMIQGNTVTCPGFYAPQGRKLRTLPKIENFLQKLARWNEGNYWLTNLEMETAGYYALGRLLGHEVISLNAIVANRATNKFSPNADKVVDSLIEKVLQRLEESVPKTQDAEESVTQKLLKLKNLKNSLPKRKKEE